MLVGLGDNETRSLSPHLGGRGLDPSLVLMHDTVRQVSLVPPWTFPTQLVLLGWRMGPSSGTGHRASHARADVIALESP